MAREILVSLTLGAVALVGWSNVATADTQSVEEPSSQASGTVEKTVHVPMWVTETRICKETRYRTETQQRKCTVYKCREVTKEVPCEYTVWVEVTKDSPQTFEVSTPVFTWVDQKYFEYKKGTAKVTKTRDVRKCVPVTEVRKVCKDEGQWVEREVTSCDRNGEKVTKKVRQWEPNIVEQEVEVTRDKWVCEKVEYECEEEVCVPVEKTRRVKKWDTRVEQKTVNHPYKTVEPRTRTKMVTVCVTEKIPEVKTYDVCVRVPYTVEKEVKVKVCRMVPKQVTVPARGADK